MVAILGPRQCGKTTLARMYGEVDRSHYFDLEDPATLARLEEPMLALSRLEGLIVIDEIQRIPNLFPILRVLVDEKKERQFLILGSASQELIRQSSETLAGRIAYIELTPFSYRETDQIDKLWLRGGFPPSFLAGSDEDSFDWRRFYVRTFLEKDIPQLGIQIPAVTLWKFWNMLAHYHGNLFNAAELARNFSVSDATIRRYLDILTGTFMVRQLPPWHENMKKRQVKTAKIYLRDSGILNYLLDIKSESDLQISHKIGALFEGFALEEVIRFYQKPAYFWRTYDGTELDLLVIDGQSKIGFEFKYMDAPKRTKSMITAIEDLKLHHLYVIYPGNLDYALSEKITVMGVASFLSKR